MRRAEPALLLVLLILGACQQEPSFDERYDAAHEKIEGLAQEIDQEIDSTEATAIEGEEATGDRNSVSRPNHSEPVSDDQDR